MDVIGRVLEELGRGGVLDDKALRRSKNRASAGGLPGNAEILKRYRA